MGKASSRGTGASIGEATEMVGEIVAVADEAVRVAKGILDTPHEVVGTVGEAARILVIGCGTIMAMDRAISKVRGP